MTDNHYTDYFVDLDNTLYDERIYLFQTYDEIGRQIQVDSSWGDVKLADFLKTTFDREGRIDLFDKAVKKFKLSSSSVQKMLEIMRTVSPTSPMKLFPDAEKWLRDIIELDKRVFVVTNGNVTQQKNKVSNIVWNGLDEKITFLFANEYAPKPKPEIFLAIQKKHNLQSKNCIMIGDSEVDLKFAENCGIHFAFISDILTR